MIIIPLIFVNIQNQWFEENFLFKASSFIIRPIQIVYSKYSKSISQNISYFLFLLEVKKNNQRLTNENTDLKIQLLKMRGLENENQRLKKMLQFKQTSPLHLLPAQIVSMDPFPGQHLITIDKGSLNGVKKNQLALSQKGVMGYVLRVSKKTAQIISLTNPQAALPVQSERSRAQGLLEGAGPTQFKLKYIKPEDDIQLDDMIVTSSLSPLFPSGLPVGIVDKAEKDEYSLTQNIEVRPAINFSQLEELFIILKP